MKQIISEVTKSKDLKDITLDMVEKILDSQISDEFMQEVPIIKTLWAMRKIYSSYTDRIFLKKAMAALLELGEVSENDRKDFIRSLDNQDSNGAEKILMMIESFRSIRRCKVYGRLCKLKAQGLLDLQSFKELESIISECNLADLEEVNKFHSDAGTEVDDYYYSPLTRYGIGYKVPIVKKPPVYLEEHETRYGLEPARVEGGQIQYFYFLTTRGELLKEYYQELFFQE